MGLIRSVKDIPDIDYYEYRDSKFYNKYRYRAKLYISGLNFTYYIKTPEELVERLNRTGYGRIHPDRKSKIMPNLQRLCAFVDWRNTYKTHKKTGEMTSRIEQDSAAIFSNDLELLLTLKEVCNDIKITEAQVEEFSGIKYYVNEPKHKYRIYLKSAHIKDKNFINDLADTLKKSQDLVASKSLISWLKEYSSHNPFSWRYNYTFSSHSIDYDNESTLSYLMLMYGDMLGKRYKLEKCIIPT